MRFYDRFVLPRLIDLAMRFPQVARYREQVVPQAQGAVLEIGVGSGLNLPFYRGAIERLYALDPSPELLALVRGRAAPMGWPLTLLEGRAEALPLDDASVDSVVMTFTLCSVGDPRAALGEIARVLKPGGRLLFAEHGLAPDASVRRWQHRLDPLWTKLAGGCHLDRPVDALIASGGLDLADVQRGYARGPRPLTYIYSGRAVTRAPP